MYTVKKETDEPFLHVTIPPEIDEETGEVLEEALSFNLIDGKSEPLELSGRQRDYLKENGYSGDSTSDKVTSAPITTGTAPTELDELTSDQPVELLPQEGAAPELQEGGE